MANQDGIILTYSMDDYTIYGDITYETKQNIKRLGQKKFLSLDGNITTFDRGINMVYAQIKLDNVSRDDYEILKYFIINVINFSEKRFDIEPLLDVDIGAGVGNIVSNVTLSVQEFGDMFVNNPPDLFTITFPYEFKKV
jgi:hypothetical protein